MRPPEEHTACGSDAGAFAAGIDRGGTGDEPKSCGTSQPLFSHAVDITRAQGHQNITL
jgi:hypothetical protein